MKRIIIVFLLMILLTGCIKDKESDKKMYIIINNIKYEIDLEYNDTVKELYNKLPLEYEMDELNSNEKYVYLDYELPSDPVKVNNIEKGDIMLYGDDCLVLFYKSFTTPYSYTKIGHINNLEELGSENITIRLEKE